MIEEGEEKADIIHVAGHELFALLRIGIIEHLVQQDDLVLELVEVRKGLRTVIGFGIWICTGKGLHEFLGDDEVTRGAAPDELLELGRLSGPILLLEFVGGFQVLDRVTRCKRTWRAR